MITKESQLQKAVKKAILKQYPSCWYYHPCDKTRRGIPDIIACIDCKFIAIELKKNFNTGPSKLQEYNILKIREAGGYAFWATSVEDVMDVLTYYLN